MDGIRLECRIPNRKFHQELANIWKTISSTDCTSTLCFFSSFAHLASCIIPETKLNIIVKTNRMEKNGDETSESNEREKKKPRARRKRRIALRSLASQSTTHRAHTVYIHSNARSDGLVSECGVWVVIGFSWIFYSFRCCALSKCSKSISCSVWFASKNRSTHKAPNALPQMLPSRIIFAMKDEKKVCCEHVALILFIFIFFWFFLSAFRPFFILFICVCIWCYIFCFYSHLPFIHSMRFHLCLVFRMRFMCFKWISRAAFNSGFENSIWLNDSFSVHSAYLRGNSTELNGSSELNWSILHNSAGTFNRNRTKNLAETRLHNAIAILAMVFFSIRLIANFIHRFFFHT